MIYEVYRQTGVPQVGEWEYICDTESDKQPENYDWNSIVQALTGETLEEQSAKGIWWQIVQK